MHIKFMSFFVLFPFWMFLIHKVYLNLPKQPLKRFMTTSILNWASKDGEFRRQQSVFRDCIEADANAKFAAEP